MVLTRTEDQLSRWKERFQDVLNRLAPENPSDLIERPLLAIRTGQITMTEVKRSLKSIKSRKAAGVTISRGHELKREKSRLTYLNLHSLYIGAAG